MNKSSGLDVSGAFQPDKSDRSVLLAATGGGIIFAGTLFAFASRLLIGILLARHLGAEQYGMYRLALTAGTIASGFALLGLEFAVVRYVALYASRQDTAGVWGTLQVVLGLTTIASLLIGVGLYALATPIAKQIFHDPRLASLLRLASLIVPFLTLSGILASATRGFSKMQYATGAQQIIQPLTQLILLGLLTLVGLTAGKAVIAYIATLIVACAMLLFFLNQLFPLRRPLRAARRETKGILLFSFPAYLSRLIDTLGPNLQTVLLGSLDTVTTVGVFSVAGQVSMVSSMFNQSIGTASSPIISELDGQGDLEQMARFYQTTTKWMFTVNLPLFLVVLLFSKPILSVFGNEFVEGATALSIMAWANLVTASAGISGGVLTMSGNSALRLVNSVVLTVLAIGLSLLLIPRWGVVGAASAAMAATTVVSLLRVSEVFVLFRMFPFNMSYLKPAVAGLVALAVGWLVRQLLHAEAHLLLSAVNALIILAIYLGMILLLGLSPEDRRVFDHIRRRAVAAFSRS